MSKLNLFCLHLGPPSRVSLFNQWGLQQTKSGVVRAHGGSSKEGTQCAKSRTVIKSTLTCQCEGTERPNQGQQEQLLNFHCAENSSSVFCPVKIFWGSLRKKSTTLETLQTHTGGGEDERPQKRSRMKVKTLDEGS